MQNWKRQIPTIMTSQELLDRAFARASRAEVNGAAPFDHVKKTNIAKITGIGDMTTTTLLKYVRAFPKMERTGQRGGLDPIEVGQRILSDRSRVRIEIWSSYDLMGIERRSIWWLGPAHIEQANRAVV